MFFRISKLKLYKISTILVSCSIALTPNSAYAVRVNKINKENEEKNVLTKKNDREERKKRLAARRAEIAARQKKVDKESQRNNIRLVETRLEAETLEAKNKDIKNQMVFLKPGNAENKSSNSQILSNKGQLFVSESSLGKKEIIEKEKVVAEAEAIKKRAERRAKLDKRRKAANENAQFIQQLKQENIDSAIVEQVSHDSRKSLSKLTQEEKRSAKRKALEARRVKLGSNTRIGNRKVEKINFEAYSLAKNARKEEARTNKMVSKFNRFASEYNKTKPEDVKKITPIPFKITLDQIRNFDLEDLKSTEERVKELKEIERTTSELKQENARQQEVNNNINLFSTLLSHMNENQAPASSKNSSSGAHVQFNQNWDGNTSNSQKAVVPYTAPRQNFKPAKTKTPLQKAEDKIISLKYNFEKIAFGEKLGGKILNGFNIESLKGADTNEAVEGKLKEFYSQFGLPKLNQMFGNDNYVAGDKNAKVKMLTKKAAEAYSSLVAAEEKLEEIEKSLTVTVQQPSSSKPKKLKGMAAILAARLAESGKHGMDKKSIKPSTSPSKGNYVASEDVRNLLLKRANLQLDDSVNDSEALTPISTLVDASIVTNGAPTPPPMPGEKASSAASMSVPTTPIAAEHVLENLSSDDSISENNVLNDSIASVDAEELVKAAGYTIEEATDVSTPQRASKPTSVSAEDIAALEAAGIKVEEATYVSTPERAAKPTSASAADIAALEAAGIKVEEATYVSTPERAATYKNSSSAASSTPISFGIASAVNDASTDTANSSDSSASSQQTKKTDESSQLDDASAVESADSEIVENLESLMEGKVGSANRTNHGAFSPATGPAMALLSSPKKKVKQVRRSQPADDNTNSYPEIENAPSEEKLENHVDSGQEQLVNARKNGMNDVFAEIKKGVDLNKVDNAENISSTTTSASEDSTEIETTVLTTEVNKETKTEKETKADAARESVSNSEAQITVVSSESDKEKEVAQVEKEVVEEAEAEISTSAAAKSDIAVEAPAPVLVAKSTEPSVVSVSSPHKSVIIADELVKLNVKNAGAVYGDSLKGLENAVFKNNELFYQRIDELTAAPAAGDDFSVSYGAWVKGVFGVENTKTASGKMKTNYNGAVFGLDTTFNEDVTLGMAFSHGNSLSKLGNKKSSVKSNMLSLYGSKKITNNLNLLASASYGVAKIRAGGIKAKSNILSANARALYGIHLGNNVFLTPSIGLSYTQIKTNKAKAADLNISKATISNFALTQGASLKKVINVKHGQGNKAVSTTYIPEMYVSYTKALSRKGKGINISDHKNMKNFRIKSDMSDYLVKLGTSITAVRNNIEISTGYEHGMQKKSKSHTGFVKLRVNF